MIGSQYQQPTFAAKVRRPRDYQQVHPDTIADKSKSKTPQQIEADLKRLAKAKTQRTSSGSSASQKLVPPLKENGQKMTPKEEVKWRIAQKKVIDVTV